MTQNQPESSPQYTTEEVRAAEAVEQASLSASQNKYLTGRVVVLRVQVNRLEKELSELRLRLHELQADSMKEDPEDSEG